MTNEHDTADLISDSGPSGDEDPCTLCGQEIRVLGAVVRGVGEMSGRPYADRYCSDCCGGVEQLALAEVA